MNINIMRQFAQITWDEYDMIECDDVMVADACENPF